MTTATPARLLRLLSLLQTPREWPGGELAERLGVSRRTVRRDIDRLRELGYPVEASKGADGGYRLVAGTAMPPLLLDDEEAVAIAVGLRAGAAHAVSGVDEASVRALAKLEQVLPARLRHRVATLQAAITPLPGEDGTSIAPKTLTALAGAVTGRERLRFAYRDKDGGDSRRLTEPYRLMSAGRRWYLVAYDLDRAGWRTFRVDRLSEPFATGVRFAAREFPAGGAAEYLRRSIHGGPETYAFEVRFAASAEEVAERVRAWLGTPVDDGGGGCVLRGDAGGPAEWLAVRLALAGYEFTVRAPEELKVAVRELGGRLSRAGRGAPEDGPAGSHGPGADVREESHRLPRHEPGGRS
ncbi:helix-turn-helix transcriptional regulator [Streptomyces sp. H49]|uniref:helix-turn-helix transcriptional regulator n=1 Tax=Streptomyces sp. H49 TaxID=3444117 RepID=UPI003F4AF4BF